MKSQPQLVREAVKAALLGATRAEDRVAVEQKSPWRANQLPAIAFYTRDERVDPDSFDTAPRELTCRLELVVEGAIKDDGEGYETLKNALDAFVAEVKKALRVDETLGGVAGDTQRHGTEFIVREEGNQPMAAFVMPYTVIYREYAPEADDVALVDLKTVDVKHDLAGAQHASNQAEDTLTNLHL